MKAIDPLIQRAGETVRDLMEDLVCVLPPMWFNSDTMQGACGISSRVLNKVLKRVGIQSEFVMGQWIPWAWEDLANHCWVEVPRLNIIVDITATQFGVPERVHIVEPGQPYLEMCRGNTATRRMGKHWEGQSHVWYSDKLKKVEDEAIQKLREGERTIVSRCA